MLSDLIHIQPSLLESIQHYQKIGPILDKEMQIALIDNFARILLKCSDPENNQVLLYVLHEKIHDHDLSIFHFGICFCCLVSQSIVVIQALEKLEDLF